jgi:hypothetical protein
MSFGSRATQAKPESVGILFRAQETRRAGRIYAAPWGNFSREFCGLKIFPAPKCENGSRVQAPISIQ